MIAFNAIHAEITWDLSDDGTLTISGTDMPNYYSRSAPWHHQEYKIKKITINYGVTNIGSWAFFGCSGLTSITIPESVTSIADLTFYGCSGLTSITIPESLTSIGREAFYGCSGLTSITIPNSVTSIGREAFYGCSSLASITIPESVTSIADLTFYGCSGLTSITIPNSVTSIGMAAFYGCTGLTSVTIPSSVTFIRSEAFCNCSGLNSITISNSNSKVSILTNAFANCSCLTSITIPNSVTYIETGVFRGCSGLTSITVENGNSIYDSRNNCNAIIETQSNTLIAGCKNTVIPNSVTRITYDAFYRSGLTSITIPESVTSIESKAFHSCQSLTSIIVEKGNSVYDSRNNCNAIIEKESNTLIAGCKNTVIPNSVTDIGIDAFYECSGLTSITIPNSVTNIGSSSFYGCFELTQITIPNSVMCIGNSAFANCSCLTSITIPNSVTSIGIYAFANCSCLTSITCEASSPPICSGTSFYKVNNSIPVYVPANSVDTYKAADEWKNFNNIKAIPYVITDGKSYTNNSQFEEQDIFYTRSFNNACWQALYIPFSMSYEDWKDDFDVAYINGIRQIDTNNDNVIDETIMDVYRIEEGSLIPNTPYLIRAKTTGEKTIFVSNATLYKAEENSIDCSTTIAKYTFTGTYKTISASTLIENEYYAMGGGSVVVTDGESDLKPFRWYLKIEARSPIYNVASSSNTAKTITINVLGEEGEATGITQVSRNDKTISRIYDLNGRAVNENALKSGMYIKNGKKFVIK